MIIGSAACGEQAAHGFQIVRRVDAGLRRLLGDRDGDAEAMPQRTQLLERLEALDGRNLECGIALQELAAIPVDADVAVDGQPGWDARCGCARTHRVPRESSRG